MSDRKRFVPVRGTEDKIMSTALGFHDGYLYVATDTGHIYIDYINENGQQVARAMLGGTSGGSGNSGIYYANKVLSDSEKLEDIIIFPIDTIEGETYPQKDDIIINIPEGSFYRVSNPSPLTSSVEATRLTIAGGGGGGSTLEEDISLRVESLESINLINGQAAQVYFTATSAKDKRGEPIDDKIIITYTLAYTEDGTNYTTYKTGSDYFNSGERSSFDFGSIARLSSSSRLTLKASQQNHSSTMSRDVYFSTSKLELTLDSTFSNLNTFDSSITLRCNAIGNMNKIVEYYFDDPDTPIYVENLNEDDLDNRSLSLASLNNSNIHLTHGVHEVWIRLFQSINGRKGIEVEPLHFEVAIKQAGNTKPLIWLGEYKTNYYSYDVIQIPFKVFDPKHTDAATVHFKKNNKELDNSPQTIVTDSSTFSYFEIADAELDVLNRYSISCGEGEDEVSRDIELTVSQDPTRADFGIQKQDDLIYLFNSVGSGRSNNESEIKRQTLTYTRKNGQTIAARLSNFNWYNNGWIRGTDNKTCLRISNGARVSIPIGQMRFAGTTDAETAHTIELQFKVRNIQNYSNLIHNITRYSWSNGSVTDNELFAEFYNTNTHSYVTSYTNYDSFLAWFLKDINPTRQNPFTITDAGSSTPRLLEYDDLEFREIQKQIDLNNIFCGYYTGSSNSAKGLCLGPQDMFFSNGVDTVSASYVENEMVSLSIVYQHPQRATSAQKLIMVYVNGSLTSVIRNTQGSFLIEADTIEFNSSFCDIDLYKLRVYNTSLNVSDIVMNYAADFETVDVYDQNKLARENGNIQEYFLDYDKMIEYNIAHPNAPLMPYIIFDTTESYPKDQQKLSFSKAVKLDIGVEFVNTALEVAYSSGELEDLAKADGLWKDGDSQEKKAAAVKTYYKHHCPSWKGNHINMAVQGTSSEFYPRRNYKLKTKTTYDDDKKSRVHIFLNRGPFQADYEADQIGLNEDKFIISSTAYDPTKTYYSDASGEYPITFDENTPYRYGVYYIKNPLWVELGKEKTRQDYWYMNNYTTGTTKFTMKIDYMESSGSYNMGFANLVKNGYSKHPLEDYNAVGAFQLADKTLDTYTTASNYKAGTTYYYVDSSNKQVKADGKDGRLNVNSAETFAMTPAQLWAVQYPEDNSNNYATSGEYVDHWNTLVPGYKDFMIPNTNDYRTSVGGFRVLAFHKKWITGQEKPYYQYIGMYNMLLDKGSDEVYGFKPDKTATTDGKLGSDLVSPLQKFVKYKKVGKIAECWEMENNNRTYCSFRDPDKRKDLTFKAFEIKNGQKTYKLNSVGSAPLVADSFEYRYHTDADILDYIMDPIKEADKYESEDAQAYMTENNVDLRFDDNNKSQNFDVRANFLWDKYKNWEKACQWVWSTCLDYVISQGDYEETVVGNNLWATGTYYILSNNDYVLDNSDSWDITKTYYTQKIDSETNEVSYVNAHAVDAAHLFTDNNKYNFYIRVNKEYVSCANEPEFNDSITYYELINYSDEQMANLENKFIKSTSNTYDANQTYYMDANGTTIATFTVEMPYEPNTYYIRNTTPVDRLVRQCTSDDVYDANEVYYTYDGTQKNGEAAMRVDLSTEELRAAFIEDFNANKDHYYVGYTETRYRGKTYKYDTKEYRGDKFINELTKHFDLEYMATYFVMTEVFECYDSRGKNCMMASWGPQESGGEYIWYPIFYDIDTQLGVNNTGIPSFEYNVDATEDGNYSTSDSVLWNNFYRFFKSSAIIAKYKHLKGVTGGVNWTTLKNPPLKSVDYIEGWYNTDPDIVGQIVMRGKRPIIAQNLDEYYKYITITNGRNEEALANGLIGFLGSDEFGTQVVDSDGKYFYMLQGNRSLARRQFLTNRIEYIDSWLNQGNYQRGGYNRIRGRVAANNSTKTSDRWVEDAAHPYYDPETGKKNHLFDAEYWLTLTPTHSSYVTLGDDNEAYPSQKYDGIHPLKFEVSAIESGVRSSANYPEQLLYIYGVNHMNDLGDMSKLYWQEFAIEGSASKLTSLRFGYDGEMVENGETIKYANNNVNNPTFGASKDSNTGGLPLLKYMNLSNIHINQGAPTLDLTSCEKLENFRATGSNYTDIQFAEGVALNTLYLPASLTTLKLTEARLLKNLITEYHTPTLNAEGELVADPGLYLEGMFEGTGSTNIETLFILGSGLGYDSFKLLKQYYTLRSRQTASSSNIQMTNVKWSPYIKVTVDEEYDSNTSYFFDNGHYGLTPVNHQTDYNINTWPIKVANGEVYRLDSSIENINDVINIITDNDIDMFRVFADSSDVLFRASDLDTNNVPNITGIIYVNNQSRFVRTSAGDIYNSNYRYYTDEQRTNAYTYDASTWSNAAANGLYYDEAAVDEFDIRNNLQSKFPNLTFFFANVNEAYTAKFLLMDEDEGINGTYTLVGSQTIKSGWFENPVDVYGDISKLKQNHDFYGWATTNSSTASILVNIDKSINTWNSQTLNPSQHTYYFYAICPIHKWAVSFYDNGVLVDTVRVSHGEVSTGPSIIPYRSDDGLLIDQTNNLLGYARTASATTPIDLNSFPIIGDTTFYVVWAQEPISVYDNIHPEWFEFTGENWDAIEGYREYSVKLIKSVKGKLTYPHIYNNKPVRTITSAMSGTSTNASDPVLADVTHIFLQKDANGITNIHNIATNTFRACKNLQYFDLTVPGLINIEQRAFQGVENLALVNNIGGPNSVKSIQAYSFANAFSNYDLANRTLLIDGSVTGMTQAFGNFNKIDTSLGQAFHCLQIGTFENPTAITSFGGPGTNAAFTGNKDRFVNIKIWTSEKNNEVFNIDNNYENLIKSLFGVTDDNGHYAGVDEFGNPIHIKINEE